MCDKLFFILFFRLQLRQHIFQGINENMKKREKKFFHI